LEKDTEIIN